MHERLSPIRAQIGDFLILRDKPGEFLFFAYHYGTWLEAMPLINNLHAYKLGSPIDVEFWQIRGKTDRRWEVEQVIANIKMFPPKGIFLGSIEEVVEYEFAKAREIDFG